MLFTEEQVNFDLESRKGKLLFLPIRFFSGNVYLFKLDMFCSGLI